MESTPAAAATGINQQISFQGKLVNTNGTNIPNGIYNMEFKIYQDGDGTTGGAAETLKWTETRLRNNSQGVTVTDGIFQVNLGSVNTNLPTDVDWNQDTLWISINLGNTNATCTPFSNCAPDGEMNPYIRLTAAPYALNSGLLDGLDSANFVQLAQGVQTDSSTANASIAINKTGGTANILQLQRGGADVLVINNAGLLTFKPQTDDALALKVQNAAATETLFAVDTAARGVSGGNLIKIGNSTGTDTATTILQVDAATADPTTNLSALDGGLFYRSDTDQLKVIENGAVARVCTTTAVCSGYESSLTFENGLTRSSNTVKLGGALTEATTIAALHNQTLTVTSALSGGARSTDVVTISQANDATNDSSGTLLQITQSDTASTGIPLQINQAGSGAAFRVNDDGTGTDSTPFVIDASGNVGIGTASPDELLHSAKSTDGDQVLLLLENSQANEAASTNETAQLRFGFGGNNDVARIVVGKEGDYTAGANEDSFISMYTDLNGTATERLRIDSAGLLTLSGYNCSSNTNGGALTVNASNQVICSDDDGGAGANATLQDTYNNDTEGSDVTIALTTADDSIIISNPASGGTDSAFVLKVEQLNTTGPADTFIVSNSGTGNIVNFQDTGTTVFNVADGGLITMQPAANLTNGQIHVTQTINSANTTASGIVTGNQLNFTVLAGTTTAATHKAYEINLTDNDSNTSHTNKGLVVTMAGTNGDQHQIGVDASANRGTAIRGVATGASNALASTCGTTTVDSGWAVGICGATDVSASTSRNIAVLGSANGIAGTAVYSGYFTVATGTATSGAALLADNGSNSIGILQLVDSGSNVLTVADEGLVTWNPRTSLTNGQTHVIQNATFANATVSGAVRGYQQNITVVNTLAGTSRGFEINLTDNSSAPAAVSTNIGIAITIAGSNTLQNQIGIDATVARGVGLRVTSTGAANGNVCSNFSSQNLAICAIGTGTNANGISASTTGANNGINNAANQGVAIFGINNQSTPTAGNFYVGVRGTGTTANVAAAYTTIGVHGSAGGGSGATAYGGYFDLSGGGATAGAALFATNSSTTIDIFRLQDNATDVLKVADAGVLTATSSTSTGTAFTFDATNAAANSVLIDAQSSSSSQYVMRLTSANGSTNVLSAQADGNVGIGTAAPSEKLHIDRGTVLQAPGTPTLTGSADTHTISSQYLSGKYIYTVGPNSASGCTPPGTMDGCELQIYDVTRASAPTAIGGISLSGSGQSIFVAGKYAYIGKFSASGTCSGTTLDGCELAIYDISNPSSPVAVGGTDTSNVKSVVVSGRYVYLGKFNDAGVCSGTTLTGCELAVYDISNPATPAAVGGISTGLDTNDMHIDGRYAYITKSSSSGTCSGTTVDGCELAIYDISNPLSITAVGGSEVRNSTPSDLSAYEVVVSGRYAYLVNENTTTGSCSGATVTSCELRIYDVSNPASPTAVGGANLTDSGIAVYIAGRYLYVGKGAAGGTCSGTTVDGCEFAIYDVSNPASPASIGGADVSGVDNIVVSGRYAYLGRYTSFELLVYDVMGMEASTGTFGAVDSGSLQVRNDSVFQGVLQVAGGINVGQGGIFSDGALGINNYATFRMQNDSSTAFQIQNSAGNSLFTADTETSTDPLKIQIGDTSTANNPVLLVVDHEDADPTGINGAFYYNTASNKIRCYENSAWGNCGAIDLQAAYTNSATPAEIILATGKNLVVTSPDVATDPNVIFNFQCTTCSAGGGQFKIQNAGTDVLTISNNSSSTSAFLFKPATNSTVALQVQPASSTTPVFNVDTTNSRVGVGTGSSSERLHVQGGSILQAPDGPSYLGGGDSTGSTNTGTGAVTFNEIFVMGRYAYVATSSSSGTCSATAGSALGCELKVYDVSTPGSPTYVGGADGSGTTNGGTSATSFTSVFVSGRYAYAVTTGSGATCSATAGSAEGCEFKIFDISNPSSPTYISGADIDGTTNGGTTNFIAAQSVYVSGRYAYMVTAGSGNTCSATAGSASGCELKIFDISNPASPTYVGGADVSGTTNGGTSSTDVVGIFVSGRYAYTVSSTSAGATCSATAGSALGCEFKIFDISNPASPTYVGGTDTDGTTNGGSANVGMSGVYVYGSTAYVTTSGSAGTCSATAGSAVGCEFQIINISNPASPTYKGGADNDGTTNGGAGSVRMENAFVSGRYAYTISNSSAGTCSATAGSAIGCELKIWDISNSASPTYVGGGSSDGTTNGGSVGGTMNGIFITGRYAFIAKNSSSTTCSATVGSGVGCEVQAWDITGIESASVLTGTINAGSLLVQENAQFNSSLSISGGLTVGTGGIQSSGSLSVLNGSFSVDASGAVVAKNTTDSTAAFTIQKTGTGIELFQVDSTNSRVYIGDTTADTTGVILVLDTKNDAGDPTGVNGAMYYNSNTGKFRCFEASSWKNCINVGSDVKSGTVSSVVEGSDTTITFTTAFSSAPFCTATTLTAAASTVISTTPGTTSFTLRSENFGGGSVTITANWICTNAGNP